MENGDEHSDIQLDRLLALCAQGTAGERDVVRDYPDRIASSLRPGLPEILLTPSVVRLGRKFLSTLQG